MLPMFLALLLLQGSGLPQAEVNQFAERVAQRLEKRAGPWVLLRVENPAGLGAVEQLAAALRESFRRREFAVVTEGEPAYQVHAYLSLRRGHPLAVARITTEGREIATLFAEFPKDAPPEQALPESAAVAVYTRAVLTSGVPVLDVETDDAGNLFVLHPERLRVFAFQAPPSRVRLELKAEMGLDTGAERLRDPLVRLVALGEPRRLELHSAARSITPVPPLPIEGYTLKSFDASVPMRLGHSWRDVYAQLQPVAGKNFFRATAAGAARAGTAPAAELYGLAPVISPLRAHWVLLDVAGRLLLADAELRPIGPPAPGVFGGDVASGVLSCAGPVVLAAGADPNPSRDRITVFRLQNDRFSPYTHVEVEGAVRRMKSLPGTGEQQREQQRFLAVAQTDHGWRIEEIELRCPP